MTISRARPDPPMLLRVLIAAVAAAAASPAGAGQPAKGPVKVFILVGQSNMQGKGKIAHLEKLVGEEPDTYGHLKSNGQWTQRDDVWIKYWDKKGELTSKDVFQHAENGDALAREIVEGTAEALAIMCVNMLHTTEPARIVFSGGMIAAGDALLGRVRHYFDEHIWTLKKETVDICFATLGEDTGIIGAAALARHALQHGQIGGAS